MGLKKKLRNDVSLCWQNKSKVATLLVDEYRQWFIVIGITKNFCKSYHAAYSNLEWKMLVTEEVNKFALNQFQLKRKAE